MTATYMDEPDLYSCGGFLDGDPNILLGRGYNPKGEHAAEGNWFIFNIKLNTASGPYLSAEQAVKAWDERNTYDFIRCGEIPTEPEVDRIMSVALGGGYSAAPSGIGKIGWTVYYGLESIAWQVPNIEACQRIVEEHKEG